MLRSDNTNNHRSVTRFGLVALLTAAAYFAVARPILGSISNAQYDVVSYAAWPAAGIVFASYWRYGWPALVGTFAGTLLVHYSLAQSLSPPILILAIANILSPLSARWLLFRAGITEPFNSIPAVLQYAVYTGLIAPLAKAALSIFGLWLFKRMPPGEWLMVALASCAAETFAMLLVAPALISWRDWTLINRKHWPELIVLIAIILLVFRQVFMADSWTWAIPLSLLLLPPIYAVLFRFNFGVMTGISLGIALLGIAAATTHRIELPSREFYFYLMLFLTMLAMVNIVMCSGLTAARRTLERLTASEERFRAMFEQAATGIVLHNIHNRQHIANHKLADMLGYSEVELALMDQRAVILPNDLDMAEQQSALLLSGKQTSAYQELRYVHRNGSILWIGLTLSLIRSALNNADFIIAMFQDISARKTAEADVERLALYDHLTGLPNRRLFGDRLHKAVSAARRSGNCGALVYIDLDNFKHLNDAHGHSAGDEVLVMVATRLQNSLREEDTVARLGGDEFVVLLQNLSPALDTASDRVQAIAHKILVSFHQAFAFATGTEFFVTASIGVTLFPKSNETAEELLKEADLAMYRVKGEQRNAMRFYAPEMKEAANLRVSLERDLRRALEREEFTLFVQPQYDAAHTLVGCEVLLRWPHSEGNMISPAAFIPIAEETGLIVPLGEWVLRSTAKIMRQFELAGLEISVSVNVSPRQFQETNFVDRVRSILWEGGADAGRLILEITEGLVVADFQDAHKKISQLRMLGIRLSIDDFGTGHSSLAYLKRLPLHELKIDRAFIKDLPHDSNDAALVEAILAMSRHLQLEVVAEGVETEAQLSFLKRRGCDRFQGYFLGHPQPPEDYFECLKDASGANHDRN